MCLRRQVKRVAQRLADKKIRLDVTEEAVTYLGKQGYDPVYGARCVSLLTARSPSPARA